MFSSIAVLNVSVLYWADPDEKAMGAKTFSRKGLLKHPTEIP